MPATNKHSEATKKRVIALYTGKQLSIEKISRKTSVSAPTIHKWLREAKVKIRKGPRYPKAKIVNALRAKKKRSWICEKFGCSPKYVSMLAKGLKTEKKVA